MTKRYEAHKPSYARRWYIRDNDTGDYIYDDDSMKITRDDDDKPQPIEFLWRIDAQTIARMLNDNASTTVIKLLSQRITEQTTEISRLKKKINDANDACSCGAVQAYGGMEK